MREPENPLEFRRPERGTERYDRHSWFSERLRRYMPSHAVTLRQFCSGILGSGDLQSKLSPPVQLDGRSLDDNDPGHPLYIAHPVRDPNIAMASGLPNLPRVTALKDPAARIRCLARFAHHELMAVELFAWALLRWPDLPRELRREFTRALADEQRHCRMYIDRLTELGGTFFDPPYSNYFWKHVPAISRSPHGVNAFLAAMGLTLEQANLDFTILYAEAFQKAGDKESAHILMKVHTDEIRHVAMAAHWIKVLGPPGSDIIEAYCEAVPFPLSAARAKAKQFDVASRRRAGLGEPFIEYVREARSNQNKRASRSASQQSVAGAPRNPLLYPNLGGEELPGKGGVVITPATIPTLRLWKLLFGRHAHFLPALAASEASDISATLNDPWWPEGLGRRAPKAAFPWLERSTGIVPWISTARLQIHPSLDNRKISSAPAGAVARVHDKAFAINLAHDEGLLPDALQNLFLVLEPEVLLDPDGAIRQMEKTVKSWPSSLGHNFTLKPRLGTSGRGRVPGVDGRVDSPAVRGALKRLAKRGGAVLEPWFKRGIDLSAQMHISESGEVTLLGTLEQIVAPSGVYLGHRAELDSRGRVYCGSEHEETLRETAVIAANRAFAEGFFGCCGIDAFTALIEGTDGAERQILRPIVEFNARFTMGTIAVGLVRRALDQVREALDLVPGTRRAFYFGLDAPESGWAECVDKIPGMKRWISLAHPSDEIKPAMVFAESMSAFDSLVEEARRTKAKRPQQRKKRGN